MREFSSISHSSEIVNEQLNTQSTPGKIHRVQKQYRDTCISNAQKHAQSIPIRDTVVKHLIDTDTKVLHDTYCRYKYLDTAHLWRPYVLCPNVFALKCLRLDVLHPNVGFHPLSILQRTMLQPLNVPCS